MSRLTTGLYTSLCGRGVFVAMTAEDLAVWRRFPVSHHGRTLASDRRDFRYMAMLNTQRRSGLGTPAQLERWNTVGSIHGNTR